MNNKNFPLVFKPRAIISILNTLSVVILAIPVFLFFGFIVFAIIGETPFNFFGVLPYLIALLVCGIVLWELYDYFSLKSTQYILYPDRIELKKRFITIKEVNVPFQKITNISLERNILERIFKVGSIKIETAGSPYPEIMVKYLENYNEFYENLSKLIKLKEL